MKNRIVNQHCRTFYRILMTCALSISAGIMAGHGQGFLLSNSVGNFSAGDISVGTSPTGWQFVAQPFSTSAAMDGLFLSNIQVEMTSFLFDQEGLFASVFDSGQGIPANELVRLQGNWEAGLQNFVPESQFALAGGKEYFLVFGSDPVKEGIFRLVTVPASGSRGEGTIPGQIQVINNNLGNWKNLNNGEAIKMELLASTAVPEPESLALIIGAILVFGYTQRRREA